MGFLPTQAFGLLSGVFLAILLFTLFLNVFGLPANWIILGLVGLWQWLLPANYRAGWFFWLILIALAVIGEILELALQVVKARKYGSSSSGTFMGMVGGIIGAIFLAPLFWGFGAFIGAVAGAWLGCFLMELLKGKNGSEALHSAFGTFMGRLLGTVCKIGVGAAMIAVSARQLWQDVPPDPNPALPAIQFLCS